jgi:Cu+-exporting ATPase
MGLATPAAIMAGANAAARRGILIRDGVALEKAGHITAVMFDKTGTLTLGQPAVAAIWPAQDRQKGEPGPEIAGADLELVTLAASLARHSSHPLSQTIAQLSKKEVNLDKWNELPGRGIEASSNGPMSGVLRLGALRWLEASGAELSPGKAFIQQWSGQGATLVGLSKDRSLLGLFALRDPVKPGAPKVIAHLCAKGQKAYLVTGDSRLTAVAIGHLVGIPEENIFAEVRPEQKAELVKQVQQRGEHVAFVGDGINDAPALEQADLGIAVSRASDIAREAADIILLRSEIEAVPESLELARATLKTIKQNLFWAFFYNAAGIPLAALGFMSPILCAAAMGLSDFVVLGNALRLLIWRSRSSR